MKAIRHAIRQAATLCRLVQEDFLVAATKTAGSHSEPVTIADYGSQAIICRALQRHYPNDGVVAEESGAQFMQVVASEQRARVVKLLERVLAETVSEAQLVHWLDFGAGGSARRTWVIDPIDGTKGFIAQRHYVVACGLLLDGQVAEGMIAAPGYRGGEGALFYTEDGESWRAPLASGRGEQVTVSQRSERTEFVAVQSVEPTHASKSRMGLAREYAGLGQVQIRELDSMEKYALVACGEADLYLRLPRPGSKYQHKIWDHAAGVALVQQAGGMVTGLDGEAPDFSRGDTLANEGLIASNGQLHARVVEAVQRVIAE